MMVRPISRMFSAISFGVFWRSAPSTSLIMRSRKVDPNAAVMRTRIQSESTCVPPVTAERRPPDSADDRCGFAGDRRFVDRSHALDHLAVRRNYVAGFDQHHVADLRSVEGTRRKFCESPDNRRGVWPGFRCLPTQTFPPAPCRRPSAMASAKFANSTVNHSPQDI